MLGYPILSMRSIPKDPKWLDRFFDEDIEAGASRRRSTSATCGRRTTRPTRRRRCGRPSSPRATRTSSCSTCRVQVRPRRADLRPHRQIIATAATPYSALHDIDANKPGGSIKIRVKTYAHTLKLHEERLEDTAQRKTS